MKASLGILILMSGIVLAPPSVRGHCDSIDGPVATAAIRSPEAKNVNLVLPYVPAEAEGELTAVFEQVLLVRGQGREAEAKALETAKLDAVLALITREVIIHGITERFEHAASKKTTTKEPLERAQVPAARDRVREELEFIGYVETLYRAIQGGANAE